MVERINNLSVENNLLQEKLSNCSNVVDSITNFTKNATSVSKYSFTCKNVMPDYDFLTKYPCYWQTRSKYGFGIYYTPAVCQIPEYTLPDVCACYWSIPEFIGTRAQVGWG